jgi:hypothetical protein
VSRDDDFVPEFQTKHRGVGGVVWTFTLPLDEYMAAQVRKGDLVHVDGADPLPGEQS